MVGIREENLSGAAMTLDLTGWRTLFGEDFSKRFKVSRHRQQQQQQEEGRERSTTSMAKAEREPQQRIGQDLNLGERSRSSCSRMVESSSTNSKNPEESCCGSSGAGTKEEEEVEEEEAMDARVWSNFPAELMEIVLAHLPFQSLIRFRNVCKGWTRLLSSRAFLDEVYEIPRIQEETWFLSGAVTQNRLALYVPSLKKWHITTLPHVGMVNFDDTVVPEATMGGLVCLTKYSRQEEWKGAEAEHFMWNPLTNDCRKLPRTRNYSWPGVCIAGMYVDFTKKDYKLITVGNFCGRDNNNNYTSAVVTEIYDSSANAWRVCQSVFPHPAVSRLTRCNICCDGSVYSITRKPYTIVAFEMTREVWREIEVPIEDVECPNLVELYNKLYIVAGIAKDESIRIWRLLEHADGRVQWIEVDRMPQELLELLASTRSQPTMKHWPPTMKHWRCVGSGDYLFLRYWGSQDVLMYSISKRSWSWLPVCDLDNKKYYYAWYGLASSPGWMAP